MSLVSCILAYWANKSLVPAVGVDANEIEDFSFMEVALGALEIAHSQLFYFLRLDTHSIYLYVGYY